MPYLRNWHSSPGRMLLLQIILPTIDEYACNLPSCSPRSFSYKGSLENSLLWAVATLTNDIVHWLNCLLNKWGCTLIERSPWICCQFGPEAKDMPSIGRGLPRLDERDVESFWASTTRACIREQELSRREALVSLLIPKLRSPACQTKESKSLFIVNFYEKCQLSYIIISFVYLINCFFNREAATHLRLHLCYGLWIISTDKNYTVPSALWKNFQIRTCCIAKRYGCPWCPVAVDEKDNQFIGEDIVFKLMLHESVAIFWMLQVSPYSRQWPFNYVDPLHNVMRKFGNLYGLW